MDFHTDPMTLTSDFDFTLPPELIAQEPPPERTAARMLALPREGGDWQHRTILDLPQFLRAGDLLVLNNTRVFPARLLGTWADTSGAVEFLLLEAAAGSGRVQDKAAAREDARPPCESDAFMGLQSGDARGRSARATSVDESRLFETWLCICGSGRRARVGQRAKFADGRVIGEVLEALGGGRVVVRFETEAPLAELLDQHGRVPVPPYIRRAADDARGKLDHERYQTVYAQERGAVAAPTAGLHFTPQLLETLQQQGVAHAFVTLHVGPGTFQPVTADHLEEHRMESERYVVPEATAVAVAACRQRGGRVVAVGSTSVRTLETVAAANDGEIVAGSGRTEIFIYPPYQFRAVNAMLTNFHLPCSTLLAMVSAFAGRERVLAAYQEAVAQQYRFFSYGDCMLIS